MKRFKNIFENLNISMFIDFEKLVFVRRALLEKDGLSTDYINWDLYIKVLQAKHEKLKNL